MKVTTTCSENSSMFLEKDEQWPPGFRFHPTDEELVLYYLKRKICRKRLKLDVIADVDVYKADPDDLPGLSLLKTGDRQWFFFSPRDRKYPNGGRSNRATRHGYWKATGKDRVITCNTRTVGIKKTLVFYNGRAPSGLRTDWVMHEYTLDEEELKRCPAQDYYALYKVFKKSGPGPKNGEQYGAPFREEDWADEEKVIVISHTEKVAPLQQCMGDISVDNTGTNCHAEPQINGFDDFLNRIANDPLFGPVSEAFGTVPAAGGDEETHSTLAEASVQERGINFPCGQLNDMQHGFYPTVSASSQFQEASEVTFGGANMNRQGSHNSEDFLELDDLFGPELTTNENIENPGNDLRIEDFDGLCELDLFQEVSTFLQDVDDTEPAHQICGGNIGNQICNSAAISGPNNFQSDVVNQVSDSYFNNFQSEMVQTVSQPSHNSLGNEMVDQFNYQMPRDADVASQLWMYNQNFSMATQAVTNQGPVIPPTSGVVYAGVNQTQFQNQNQVQTENGNENKGGESWFSSTLWSFVETIPTTPASAAESTVLVNKAFQRLSSFSRRGETGKLSLLRTSTNVGNPTATCGRSPNKSNKGLLLFSVLGLLCAILWVYS